MAGLTLADYRTKLRLDLDASATEFPDANVDRAVQRAVQDLSRIMPNEDIYDVSINDLDITDEAFTTQSSAGTHRSLANSPIHPGSERVYKATDDGTTYQRGTDYEIDYDAGSITHLSGGDLSDSTAYSIDYDKSRRSISLSGIATGFIAIRRIEYRAGASVQQWRSFLLWGDELFIQSPQQDVQTSLVENSNILIYYTKEWSPPGASSEGNFPDHLDEVISKGAISYLLEARSYGRFIEAQADVSLANAEFALANVALDAANTKIDAWATPAAWTTAVDAANAALDDVDLEEAGEAGALLTAISFSAADTALNAAATATTLATSTLAGVSFANLTTELAKIDTRIDSNMDDQHVEANVWLDDPSSGTTADAKTQLETGDGKIDTLNQGDNVAAEYREYANSAVNVGRAFIEKAGNELLAAQTFVQSSQLHLAEEQATIAQAQATIQNALAITQRAAEQQDYNQIRIDGARAINEQEALKMQEAQGYLLEASERLKQNQFLFTQIETYLGEASQRVQNGRGMLEASREEREIGRETRDLAILLRDEFFQVLRERMGLRRQVSESSVAQPVGANASFLKVGENTVY
tara:strand:+ start:3383 stop:5137 length:1755 start_codon:yes stop_codon:yes gene_type:complete